MSGNQVIDMLNKSEFNFADFKHSQETPLPAIVPQDLSGQVYIVTGANAGLGFEIAKAVASMKPALLILACRNAEKAQKAAAAIQEGNTTKIEIESLDLSSFESVKAFASRFLARNIPLDALISNAGLSTHTWEQTKDGYEITIQVNHLSNALLCLLLTPALKKAPKSRVVVVASDVHFWASRPTPEDPTPLKTVLTEVPNVGMGQYLSSKLLNVLFVNEYAKRNTHKNIVVCSCNPGFTESELGAKDAATGEKPKERHHQPGLPKKRTTYEGAKTLIQCSIRPHQEIRTGAFYSDMKDNKKRSWTTGEKGEEFANKVWKETMEVLYKVVDPGLFEEWTKN